MFHLNYLLLLRLFLKTKCPSVQELNLANISGWITIINRKQNNQTQVHVDCGNNPPIDI